MSDLILNALTRAHKENRLHHAYVLSGSEADAKIDCVERFAAENFCAAAGLFATSDPAAALERIRRGNHPDFTRLSPGENGTLGVDEVRELPKLLAFAPLEAAKRVVIVTDAVAMNAQAANAILKILEEPPAHTMFFLLARDTENLLETIVSRCQVLRFFPLSEAELSTRFAGVPLAWCEGSLDRAKAYSSHEGAEELRKIACEHLLSLWENSPRVPSAAVAWVEALSEELDQKLAVEAWELLSRDLAYSLAGASAVLRFPEYRVRLEAIAKSAQQEDALYEVGERFSSINRYRVQADFHANARLALSNLLCELQVFSVGKNRQNV
jgi:DNA polymerase III delta prime subunit